MDASTLQGLLIRIARLERSQATNRIGRVTATAPLAVSIAGGAPIADVKAVAGQTFAINDLVLCQTWQATLIVIGVIE